MPIKSENLAHERPILFSAPMVCALLDGSKTQTRRIIKPQPTLTEGGGLTLNNACYGVNPDNTPYTKEFIIRHSPYGQPGDQLWVRENFQPIFAEFYTEGRHEDDDDDRVDYKTGHGYEPSYPATDGIVEFVNQETDDLSSRVWPSIFMPRWASRIQLEITAIRVERLQDIGEDDAIAEGVTAEPCDHIRLRCEDIGCCGDTAKGAYQWLWNSINGAGRWDANPWVWVVEFKRINTYPAEVAPRESLAVSSHTHAPCLSASSPSDGAS